MSTPAPTPATIPTQIVLGILGLFGFNPNATPSPSAPVAPSSVLQQIWAGWQQINRRLFNSYPTVSPSVIGYDPTTGAVLGTIGARDPDGDVLRYSATGAVHGTITIDQKSGTFVYTPDAAYAHALSATGAAAIAPEHIVFTATDDVAANGFHLHLFSTTSPSGTRQTITIPVVAVNKAPTGTATGTYDPANGTTRYTLSTSDKDGDPVTVTVTTPPARGTLSAVANGYLYTPNAAVPHAAAAGGPTSDTVVLTLTDGHGGTSALTLAPTFAATNISPVVTVTVRHHDGSTSNPKGSSTIAVDTTDADGDPVTVAVAGGPTHGSLTSVGPGTYLYTPDPAVAHNLSAGGSTVAGSDSISITANDGHGSVQVIPVSLVITPENTQPAGTVVSTTRTSATSTTFVVSTSDPDGDTVTQTVLTAPSHGTYDLVTGVYTASGDYAHGLLADGSDTIVVQLSDGHGGNSSVTLIPAISPVNSDPVVTLVGSPVVTSTGSTVYATTVSDPDGDQVILQIGTAPLHGSVTTSGSSVAYTPDTAFAASIGTATTDTFTVVYSDGHRGTKTVTFTPTITPVNLAPTLEVLSTRTNADGSTTYVVSTVDGNGDPVTVTVSAQPSHGTVSIANRTVTYTPDPTYAHNIRTVTPDGFSLVASDGRGGASAAVNLAPLVTPANNPVSGSAQITSQTPSLVVITVTPSDGDGDPVTVTATADPRQGSVSVSGTTVEFRPNSSYTHEIPAGTTATVAVTLTLSDGHGSAKDVIVPVVLAPTNSPLTVIVGPPDSRNGVTTYTVVYADADNDTVRATVTNRPRYGSVFVSGGTVTYTNNDSSVSASADPFTIEFSDQHGSTVTKTFENILTSPAPTISLQAQNQSGNKYGYTISATDAAGRPVQVFITQQPAHGTVTVSGTTYTYVASPEFAHQLSAGGQSNAVTDSFTLRAIDSRGSTVERTLYPSISPVNTAPSATTTTVLRADGSTLITVYPFDTDRDTVSVIPGAHSNGSVTSTGSNTFVWTPFPAFANALQADTTQTISFILDDGHGSRPSVPVDVVIKAPAAGLTVTSTAASAGGTRYVVTTSTGAPATLNTVAVSHGAVTATADGFTFTPDPAYAHSLTAGGGIAAGSGSVTFEAIDARGNQVQQTVTPVVVAVNSNPTLTVATSSAVIVDGTPRVLSGNSTGVVSQAVLVNNGRSLLVFDGYGRRSLVDIATGVTVFTTPYDGAVAPTASAASASGAVAVLVDGTTGVLERYYRNDLTEVMEVPPTTTAAVIDERVLRGNIIGPLAFLGSRDSSTVTVVDTLRQQVSGVFTIPGGTGALVASPDGSSVFAVDQSSGAVWVIDTTTMTARQIPNLTGVLTLASSANGRTIYVARGGISTTEVAVVDVTTGVVRSVQTPRPYGIDAPSVALSPDQSTLYVVGSNGIALSYNTATLATQTGSDPQFIGLRDSSVIVAAEGTSIYLVGQGDVVERRLGRAYVVSAADADGDQTMVSLGTNPTRGTVYQRAPGTFVYVPSAMASGTDSFVVVTTDGHGGRDFTTITI